MLGPLGALSPHPGVSYLFTQSASGWGNHPSASATLGATPSTASLGAATLGTAAMGGGAGGSAVDEFGMPTTAGAAPPLPSMFGERAAPDNSLQAIANAGSGSGAAAPGSAGGLATAAGSWTPLMGELIQKIDAKLKVSRAP
jgi:hypothetical protein